MQIDIYRDGENYYVCQGQGTVALRWFRDGEHWTCVKEKLPPGLEQADVGELPGDLQEELLAFLTRAEMMGNQIWSSPN